MKLRMRYADKFFSPLQMNSEAAQANQVALEAISAIRVVSAYSLQAKTSQLFKQVRIFFMGAYSTPCMQANLLRALSKLFVTHSLQLAMKSSSKSAHISGLSFGLSQVGIFVFTSFMQ